MEGASRRLITTLINRKLIVMTLVSLVVVLHCLSMTEARAVPRSSSRSFRFPSSSSSGEHDTFKDSSSTLFSSKHTRESSNSHYTENNQGRNAITLENSPIKASHIPESPGKPSENNHDSKLLEEDTLSSEIIEGDLSVPEDDEEFNHDEGKNAHEDEVLREALCPPVDKNISSTNVSTSLSPYESDIVISSGNSNKLRYDLQAGKCAEVGKREHCGNNMIFVAEIDSAAYGYCECDFGNKILRKETKHVGIFTKTPLVFHPRTNACYRLYEQAYCKEGEWLVLSRKEKGPVCERNQCSSTSLLPQKEEPVSGIRTVTSNRRRTSKLLTPTLWADGVSTQVAMTTNVNGSAKIDRKAMSVWVPLNGSGPCVKLFERNSDYCEDDEQVVFNVGDIVPKCGLVGREIEGRAIIRNACPPGSYYSLIGKCQPDWDF